MKIIWGIFKRDMCHATRNVIAVIVSMGLVMVPALYAWFNIAASWNPYGNTKALKVAVANNDKGYKSDLIPVRVNVGETIISIVECLLREKHRMFANYEPTYREIRAEVSSLRAANPQIADLDLLQAGQWVTIPAIVVCEALTGQGSLANKSLAS